jgi:ATP-dependent exoDNAse (exonuclease V) beta subunit
MTLVDADARRTIREDLGATLVVEAAAGTGKTTEMIARIIAVIRTGATTLERIVAVTFTEKAAGEMKLRLRTELERARKAASGAERDRFEAALGELEVARVGSIHSFCADLLRERPIEARVDPLFEVAAEDEAERLFHQAFDTWFQARLAAPGEGVRRILRRDDPTDLLRRAGWSVVERRDFDGAWRRDPFDREAAIDHVIDELAVIGDLAAKADRPTEPLADLFGSIARWIAELGRRELVRGRDHDGLEAELARLAKWWQWKYAGRTKLYGAGLLRADVVAQRDAVKAELDTLLEAASADLAACLHEELRPLVDEYERLKARTGQLDFLDLLARTRDLLREDRGVREEMQQRFTHFFVDEFQDTDPLQAEILLLLCADDPVVHDPAAVQVRPGKLFVVGDPKQAIYRFRRADIALYEAVKQRLLGQGAHLVHLSTSFRSVPSIQSAVNAAFEPVMRGDGQAEYVPLEKSRADIPGQPSVIALPVPAPYGKNKKVTNYAIDTSYPDAVAAFIDYLTTDSGWKVSERDRSGTPRDVSARHVCLMFRRFQSFGSDLTRPYVRALEARGIPHVLVGGRSFHEREEIEAMHNALAAIEWPDDELSVYATLRGPLFAFHDEDLVAFQHAHARLRPLQWLEIDRPDRAPHASEAMRAVAIALSILATLHVGRNRRPIADTIARLLATTRAHAGLAVWPAGEQALANVLRVLDLARRFESGGAISFRAFVERLAADAERGKQPDAPVVEAGTDGVRIMTVHAAKGLEFPVVILCDPTAPLGPERPSRYIDNERRVWLEPLAGCVPAELREHEAEILQRDREEVERLAYVAATRARDLLIVPVVGDEERESWLQALSPTIYPAPADGRKPARATGCPAFGPDSVVTRPLDRAHLASECVAPGQHTPRAGTHAVVWWDPHLLDLNRSAGGGLRQRQILQADAAGETASASERAHADWQERRKRALDAGSVASLVVQSVTHAARVIDAGPAPVMLESTSTDRSTRPTGKRFGSLVHGVLAAVELHADEAAIHLVVENQARLVGATNDEVAAAVIAVQKALAHPLLGRAAAAEARGSLRREVPVVLRLDDSLIEGVVDLAFSEPEDGRDIWTVVDFKTDAELSHARAAYEAQVRLYAAAISTTTGQPAVPVLFVI